MEFSTWVRGHTQLAAYTNVPSYYYGRSYVFKGRSSYLDSSFSCSESQNIIKVNLLGTLLYS